MHDLTGALAPSAIASLEDRSVTPPTSSLEREPLAGAFAFVDLETTGTDASRDRVTEIGIVHVVDGEVVDEWQSLIDPGVPIPAEIQRLTGITNDLVRGAPTFAAVAGIVRARLGGHLFVAHNARFDYGFLKAEFRRLGERFVADVLCTVRLSRALYPEHPRHNLDTLIERHRLATEARHRALGDARLIADFLRVVVQDRSARVVDAAVALLLRRPVRPTHLPEDALDDLPEGPGVYLFRGVAGQPLYVGKARNLRSRIRGHFYGDSANSIDASIALSAHAVETEETGGELTALLREIQIIRREAPLLNRALRRQESVVFFRLDAAGFPVYLPLARFDPAQAVDLYGPFASRQSARAALAELARAHRLCDRAIGLWRADRPCFSRQIGRCLGLCCGGESAASHRSRFVDALAPLRYPAWPCPGAFTLREHDEPSGRTTEIAFDRWCALDPARPLVLEFDLPMFRLLRRRLPRFIAEQESGS